MSIITDNMSKRNNKDLALAKDELKAFYCMTMKTDNADITVMDAMMEIIETGDAINIHEALLLYGRYKECIGIDSL